MALIENVKIETAIARIITTELRKKITSGEAAPPVKAKLYDYYHPTLLPGAYEVSLEQKLTKKANGTGVIDTFSSPNALKFDVVTPDQPLNPQEVHTVYPPKNSKGQFDRFLPHLVLNKSTLPWEALHHSGKKGLPWLALIVLNEEETEEVLPTGGNDNDVTTGITVKIPKKFIPTDEELKYLAHVMHRNDGKETAVLLANRLPTPGKLNTVYLVTLNEKGKNKEVNEYKALHSWNFTCDAAENSSFDGIISHLDRRPFALPYMESASEEIKKAAQAQVLVKQALEAEKAAQGAKKALKTAKPEEKEAAQAKVTVLTTQATVIRSAATQAQTVATKAKTAASKDAKHKNLLACFQKGYVPLPHATRIGDKYISWYRGPLVPFRNKVLFKQGYSIKAIFSSDQLLRYFEKTKRLDTSYASAWELGKWMTLQRKEIAKEIYNWKKKGALVFKQKHLAIKNSGVKTNPFLQGIDVMKMAESALISQSIPDSVMTWLLRLVTLNPIPFSYLVPHEQVLPEESIRFFHLDDSWIWSLIDGALSIGRTATELDQDSFKIQNLYLWGCMIRSSAIHDYPDMQIAQVNGKDYILPIEKRLIGKDIVLCIFRGEAKTIDNKKKIALSLPPEGMHFGVSVATEPGKYKKKNKLVPFKANASATLDVVKMAKQIKMTKDHQSSLFAKGMIEGAAKVIFFNG